jgi:CHASE1-domain containing sensor protein
MQAETSYSKNKGVFSRWFSATFVVGLLVSALIAQGINHQNADKITAAAKNEAIRVADDVVNRIHLYQYGLRGARGAIATVGVEHITRDMFARYSKTRDVQNEFPGARGFGFIQRVPAIEQTQFVENEHLDGRADFKVRQFAPHEGDLYIIRYIEPERNNLSAVGLDIASELNRRQAADLAATTGDVKLTPPITLVQASGNPLQ